MVYGALRALIRTVLAVFYRRVEVVGVERVPARGPIIVAANHQNALVDPMLVIATLPRRLTPIAKAPLFRHPLIAPFLHAIGAIPVHRRQEGNAGPPPAGERPADGSERPADGSERPERNAAMFRAATARLARGGAILIFPEGLSQPEPALMPLRTGAARMLLTAAREHANLRVTLLPVGLVLHEPGTFRMGRALVVVGAPIELDRAPEGDAATYERAVQALTERLADGLRDVIVEAENRETLRLLALLEAIAADGAPRDASARAAWMRRAMEAYRRLQASASARAARFREDVERYAKDLELAGLAPAQPGRGYRAGAVWRFTLRETAALVGGLPVALWGIATHAVPYQLTALAVRLLRPDPDEEATYKIIAGVVLYPLCWIAEGLLAWRIGGVALLTLFVLGLLPAAFFALTWQERLARFVREARAFLRFVVDRDLDERLAARRRALVEEMRELARLAETTRSDRA
jgi:glycerol-3-phosphate O-acyltransferase/dihydroxyacetone phosphate acyltransferase